MAMDHDLMVAYFIEITSSPPENARAFLASQGWDLEAALSTFFSNDTDRAAAAEPNLTGPSPDYNPPESSPSPAGGEGSDEYYTGGEKSGMIVQDPEKPKDIDALFEQARQSAEDRHVESSSTSFTGATRLLSGETVSPSPQKQQQELPQMVMHTITQ